MNEPTNAVNTRRDFLKASAGVAAVTLAPGVLFIKVAAAKRDDEAVSSTRRWGMLINTAQCTDCGVCVDACVQENGITSHDRPLTDPHWIRKMSVKDTHTGHVMSLPMLCQHCESPPCVDVCPTGASFRREDGIVLVDKHICIGCRYCMMACPYKARSFIHEVTTGQRAHAPRGKGTVESCTMCVHRVDAGEEPACVVACNSQGNQAMVFGDTKDPESRISRVLQRFGGQQVRADLGLNTGVRYLGL
ncbi:MAG: sulfate reduction electron transfer complex DsrMKJOP subunit DsrO [Thiotrichales bacterium]